MSTIEIQRFHQLGAEQAKNRLSEVEPKLSERYGIKLTWRGDDADIRGTGVTGSVTVRDDTIALRLKLGLLVRPFARKIREAIERQVDKALL